MEKRKSQIINEEFKYSELTGEIIGCAMKVHSTLGAGFPEVIYQRALKYEMNLRKLNFTRENGIPVFYKDIKIGIRKADFIVENKVVVEIKAIKELENRNYAQVLNYLEAYKKEVGLLLNFGSDRLQLKRFIKTLK